MTDSLTVLECVPGKRAAKLYRDPQAKPDPYDAGFLFRVEQIPIASLAELAQELDTLRLAPRKMVIRDRLRADAQPTPSGLYARRRVDRPGDPAPFEHAPHYWACFDADATATAFDSADPVGSVERWRAQAPEALREAAMVFQFSASQHLHPTIRGHCWVWLAEPVGNVPLARWAVRNGLDPAMFHAVQPHYTADPVFADLLADPLAPRELVCLDGSEAVDLGLTEEDHAEGALPSQGGVRGTTVALEEIGDPSEAGAEARAIIVAQLARHFSAPGKRWDLCGHIGGACANAGLEAEEACAILEALRAGDVPDHEFAAGLRWALGAYSFSAKPLGIKGIAGLLGPITAERISAGLRLLAEANAAPPEPAPSAEPGDIDWRGLPFEAFSSADEPDPIPYIIPTLNLGPGKPTAIVGYAYSSKTPWALELAVCIASGATHFQGHVIAYSCRVLYIATEGARNARRKAARIAKAHGTSLSAIGDRLVIVQAPPGFLTVETAEKIGEQADTDRFGLVIIDTYNSAFDGSKDRNTNEFSLALKVFGDISDRSAVTFCPLMHCRKTTVATKGRAPTLQEIDGHNSIAGAVQAAIGLWRPTLPEDDKHVIAVECVRAVDDAFEAYCIKWTDTPCQGGDMGLRAELTDLPSATSAKEEAAGAQAVKDARAKERVVQLLAAQSWTYSELANKGKLGCGRSHTERVLQELVDSGEIIEEVIGDVGGGAGKGWRYKLAPTGPVRAEARAKRTGFLGPKKK